MVQLLWLALIGGCSEETGTSLHAIVVVIDGVRVDEGFAEFESSVTERPARESMPRIWSEIGPSGGVVLPAYNMGSTVTAPGHAAILTGRQQPFANLSAAGGPGLYRSAFPTIGEELRRQESSAEIELLANQDLIWALEWSTTPGYGESVGADWTFVAAEEGSEDPAELDGPVIDALIERLDDGDVRFAMANLKRVDRMGHYGRDAEEYASSTVDADAVVADLWDWLQSDDRYADQTILVITSDHGRHRSTEEKDRWRDHGTHDVGDRQVPLMIAGPEVRGGKQIEVPHALTDIAPTIAGLMGVEMPWAKGLPIEALLKGEDLPARVGVGAVAADGGWVVEEILIDDSAHRAEIWWQDTQLSDPEAWAAEAPAVVAWGDDALTCWREMHIAEDWMPWIGRCALLGADGSITEVAPPEDRVGPQWRPELKIWGGDVLATYDHNPDDISDAFGGLESFKETGARAARLSPELEWQSLAEPDFTLLYARYPVGSTSVAWEDGQWLTAFAGHEETVDSRHIRRIYLTGGQLGEEDAYTVEVARELDLSDLAPLSPDAYWRLEAPVLYKEGERVDLYAMNFYEGASQLIKVTSQDRGATWGEPEVITDDPGLSPHLPPVLAGERITWVTSDGQIARLCAEGANCQPLSSPWVQQIAWDGSRLHAITVSPGGKWMRATSEPR